MGARILLAEDDPKQSHLIRAYLEREGHSVLVTDNGRSALELARTRQPDLVVLDVSDGVIPVQPGAGQSDVDIPAARLTQREEEVLRLLAEGLGMAEIAERLSYSERTVKNVFYGVTARLKLRNRPHAVAYALRAGLI